MVNGVYQTAVQASLSDANDELVVKLPSFTRDAWDQPAVAAVFSTAFRVLEPLAATAQFSISLREVDSQTVLETVTTETVADFADLAELGFQTTVENEVQYELAISAVDTDRFSPALFEVMVDVIPQFAGTGDSFGINVGHELAYFGATNIGDFTALDASTSYYLGVSEGTAGENETLNLVYDGPDATVSITNLRTGLSSEQQIADGETLPISVSGAAEVLRLTFSSPASTGTFRFELGSDTLGARIQNSPMVYIGDYASSDYSNLTVTDSTAAVSYVTPELALPVGQNIALNALFDFSDDVTHVYLNAIGKTSLAAPALDITLSDGTVVNLDPVAPTTLTLDQFRTATITYDSITQEGVTLIGTGRRLDAALGQAGIFNSFNQFDTSGYAKIDLVPTQTQVALSLDQTSLAEGSSGTLTLQIQNFDFAALTTNPEIRLINYSQDIQFQNQESAITLSIPSGSAITIPITARQDADVLASETVEIIAEIVSNDSNSTVLETIPLSPLSLTVTDLVPIVSVNFDQATILNDASPSDAFIYSVTVENWDQVESKFLGDNAGLYIKPELSASFDITPIGTPVTHPTSVGHYQFTDATLQFSVTAKAGLAETDTVPANLINRFYVNGKEIDLGAKYLDVKWVPSEFAGALAQSGTAQGDQFAANALPIEFNGLAGNDTLSVATETSMVGSHFDGGDGTDTLALGQGIAAYAFGFSDTNAPAILSANDPSKSVSMSNVETVSFADTSYSLKLTSTGGNLGTTGADLFFVGVNGSTVTDTTSDDNDIVASRFSVTTSDFSGVEQFMLVGTDNTNLDATGSLTGLALVGNTGNNKIGGTAGHDAINGGAGNDRAFGGAGNDSVDGGDDDDTVLDSWGSDTLLGGAGADTLIGFEGGDTIDGGAGADVIYGGRHGDHILGGADNDVIYGDTVLFASRGADTIEGGIGDDLLQGGFGADTFVFNATTDGNDTIARIVDGVAVGADFESGVDQVRLLGFGYTDAADVMKNIETIDGNAVFADQSVSITFTGITQAELSADDFIFV